MVKEIWKKIKQNHLLMMAICCLAPLVLLVGFFSFFKDNSSYWTWLIVLLCPLMHLFIMRGHKHNDSCAHKTEGQNELYQCPECGLKYQEKEWAEKCKEWCQEYKSCNLEITKRAIKD